MKYCVVVPCGSPAEEGRAWCERHLYAQKHGLAAMKKRDRERELRQAKTDAVRECIRKLTNYQADSFPLTGYARVLDAYLRELERSDDE